MPPITSSFRAAPARATARPAAALTAAVLLFSACGTDANAPSASPVAGAAKINCPSGKNLGSAGASSIKRAVANWTSAYQSKCSDIGINYDAQGSGNGRTQFVQKQVPGAGSDVYMPPEQRPKAQQRCAPGQTVDLPMSIEPVAIAYHLDGVSKLTVNAPILAKIFNGKIKNWNDPTIAAANPGVTLPNKTITPIHRSVDSGTSENLTRFLVAQARADCPYQPSQAWPNSIGPGAAVSLNMVQLIKSTDGAIGYVDNPDAASNSLTVAGLDTGNGPVKISPDSIAKVIDASKITKNGLDITVDVAYGLKKPGAYPALMVTYLITCSKGLPSDQAALVKSFVGYAASDGGQSLLVRAGYISIPEKLRAQVQSSAAQLSAR